MIWWCYMSFKYIYEIWEWDVIYEFYNELMISWYIENDMKSYDDNWCMSVWKDEHDDFMVWKHEHKTKS
jgi:hypothetical protein